MGKRGAQVKPIDAIDRKWQTMPTATQDLIRKVVKSFERKLIDSYDEITAAVNTSGRQGSFSATLSVSERRGGDLEAKLSSRVRKAQEDDVFAVHLDDDRQLVLGLGPIRSDDEEEDDEGEGE